METVPLTAQHLTAAGVGDRSRSQETTLSPERERSGLGVNGPHRLCLGYLVIRWRSCFGRLRQDLTEGVGPWRCLCPLVLVHHKRKKPVHQVSLPSSCLPTHMEPSDYGLSLLTISQTKSFFFRLFMPSILSPQVTKPVNMALRISVCGRFLFTFKNT